MIALMTMIWTPVTMPPMQSPNHQGTIARIHAEIGAAPEPSPAPVPPARRVDGTPHAARTSALLPHPQLNPQLRGTIKNLIYGHEIRLLRIYGQEIRRRPRIHVLIYGHEISTSRPPPWR